MRFARSRNSLSLLGVLVLLVTSAAAQTTGPKGGAVDPYGNPLPSHHQQLQQLERLLGRQINDSTPIERGAVGNAAVPYQGADAPVAYMATNSVPQPTSDDLSETPDIQFTPQVQSVVAQLGADPQGLYLYVKNGWVYTPYFGSQKGSRGTELELQGNDYDQASLLIALLREAGIPARYVVGSMYIPTAQALNWLQVDSTTAALNLLAWQGIPAQFVQTGGGSLLIDRVWVEAFVDRHGPNPRWVPMDPAFKQYQITPASPLATAVSFDQNAFLNLPLTDPRTPYEFLSDNLQSYLNTAAPGTTVDQVARRSSIIPVSFSKGLPGKLENQVKNRTELSQLTDSQRYLVAVGTVDAQGVSAQTTLRLPEVYSQRLTISFPPATSADQALVQASGGYYNTPADQLHVVASINLNGQAIATGSRAVAIGAGHYIVVDLLYPGASQPVSVFHTVFAGGYYGLGLDVQGDLEPEISERKDAYLSALSTVADPTYDDSTTGDFMNSVADSYLESVQTERLQIGALYSQAQAMDVSEALTMQNITIEYVNGVWQFRPLSWVVDAQRLAGRLFADNGNDSNFASIETIDGLGGSFLEARLWDTFQGLQSISTTRGLQVANAEGIPIFTINQANAASLIPLLNVFPDVLQNVEYEVNAGFTVTIPQNTLVLNQWVGSVWIEKSADLSSSAYLIEGGLFGGSTTKDPKNRHNQNPACSALDADFDQNSGPFDSDFDRAVALQESAWRQFNPDGSTFVSPNKDKDGNILSYDIGIMQVNSKNIGKTISLPGGTPVTINQDSLYNDPAYNIEIGAAILNTDLVAAQKYLSGLGYDPSNSDLITEGYYLYNHGSNLPPGFIYDSNGNLIAAPYDLGQAYKDSAGNNHKVNQGALDAQNNALKVQKIYNNQSWLTRKRGCQS
jgi:hypothetical protein